MATSAQETNPIEPFCDLVRFPYPPTKESGRPLETLPQELASHPKQSLNWWKILLGHYANNNPQVDRALKRLTRWEARIWKQDPQLLEVLQHRVVNHPVDSPPNVTEDNMEWEGPDCKLGAVWCMQLL